MLYTIETKVFRGATEGRLNIVRMSLLEYLSVVATCEPSSIDWSKDDKGINQEAHLLPHK